MLNREKTLTIKEPLMILPIKIALVILSVIFFLYIVRLVSNKKLLLSYSLLWLLLSVLIAICAFFPDPLYYIAHLLGIELPSNFVFIVAILCLLAIALSLSIVASRQTAYSKTLIQEVALLRKELDELNDKNGSK